MTMFSGIFFQVGFFHWVCFFYFFGGFLFFVVVDFSLFLGPAVCFRPGKSCGN